MNILLNFTCLCTYTLLALSSCSENPSNNKNKETEHHHHDDHDHANHNHDHQAPATGEDSDHNDHTEQYPVEGSGSEQAATPTIAQGSPSATIPAFTFYKVKSGISFTQQDIPKGQQKTVFILFDPSCSHCRSEANALGKNYDLIKNINLFFVSMNDPALMASFLETFAKELVNKPNVQVLYDRNQEFIQKFHVPKQFPANYIYSKEGKLETFWDGDKNIKEIIAAYTR
ncbi:peroxiredoxin family protein [Parapedobacter sp. SGR-10]|uniref:redoxin domain-containing protein n=1 Tax=Parapedobacter sp. SGR-10 TaxID=2710879 RepID=UPI0013D63D70|nr:redoxin domain-containing protein [Parapedobacter sp. SGR-10]NGF58024.1 peroxiredoxin family protein [Parapedobacter sp. SGR-10]